MRTHLDIKHTGTLGDDRTKMTFDENSVAHLMSVLTDMYSDPMLAVIREYSTNAFDSHRAAGIDKPIEITSPTDMNPLFVVVDHGVGMSEEDILERFSKYGYSSKRETDNEVGMLGLGCKAGLTYTSQFTLMAFKDGVRCTALVTRDADGAGAVQIIESGACSDANGVEVRIPVKQVHTFVDKIADFFQYWDRGTVLIDGAPPAMHIWEDDDEIEAKLLDPDVLVTGGRHGSDVVVMGNVPYEIPWTDSNNRLVTNGNMHAVVRVPIGAVNFTPSREALHFTKRTIDTIRTAREFIQARMLYVSDMQIEAQPTHTDAIRESRRWTKIYGWQPGQPRYRGAKIPTHWYYPDVLDENGMSVNDRLNITEWNGYADQASRTNVIGDEALLDSVHVIGFTGNSLHASAKEKLKKYAQDTFGKKRKFLCYPKPFLGDWIDGCDVVSWDEIKAIDLGKPKAEKKKNPTYQYVNRDGTSRWSENKPDPLVHLVLESSYIPGARREAYCVAAAFQRGILVITKTQNTPKWWDAHPGMVRFKDWLVQERDAFVAGWSEFDKLVIARTVSYREVAESRHLVFPDKSTISVEPKGFRRSDRDPLDGVLDRDLADLMAAARASENASVVGRFHAMQHALSHFQAPIIQIPTAKEISDRIEAAYEKYPLLKYHQHRESAYGHTAYNEFIQYVNDTYLVTTRQFHYGEGEVQ